MATVIPPGDAKLPSQGFTASPDELQSVKVDRIVLPAHPIPIPAPGPQPTVTQLPSPALGGAIGCDFRSGLNQLLFVEFPSAMVVSQGTTVLKGTFTFDLETGIQGGVSANADIWWDQMTTVARQMVPQNGAGILNLGAVDFDSLSASGLQKLPYGSTPIPGSNDATNKLVNGDVFAVRTNAGNFRQGPCRQLRVRHDHRLGDLPSGPHVRGPRHRLPAA